MEQLIFVVARGGSADKSICTICDGFTVGRQLKVILSVRGHSDQRRLIFVDKRKRAADIQILRFAVYGCRKLIIRIGNIVERPHGNVAVFGNVQGLAACFSADIQRKHRKGIAAVLSHKRTSDSTARIVHKSVALAVEVVIVVGQIHRIRKHDLDFRIRGVRI